MVIYQVYPRSFQDTNGDGVGDLRGILERLEYIARLNVDHVWISPFFRSPQHDFCYDVSDYRAVDPLFGTLDDFHALVAEARRLGMGILVDMVASHTSDEHEWFRQSRAREGDKADWYLWADPGKALHPYCFQQHVYDGRRPETFAFLERIRTLLDEFDAFSIAEVGGDDALAWMAQCVSDKGLHSAYSFDLLRNERDAPYVRSVIEKLQAAIPTRNGACYALSNHDKPRVVTRWGEGRDAQAHARQMLALLACLPGTVVLYQGEELGLPQAEVPFERLQDPIGKSFWPKFKGRDGCRTPMPWTGQAPHGGFSNVEPWLPVDGRHLALNVAEQEISPKSVLSVAREMFSMRRDQVVLQGGDVLFLEGGSAEASGEASHMLIFARVHGDEALVCAFNLDDETRELPNALEPDRTLVSQGLELGRRLRRLEPCGFAVFEVSVAELVAVLGEENLVREPIRIDEEASPVQ